MWGAQEKSEGAHQKIFGVAALRSRLAEISCCLAPDDVSATEHSASPVLLRGTACHPTFELHQHYHSVAR